MFKGLTGGVAATAAMLVLSTSGAKAIDVYAGDYTPLPSGSNVGITYFQYGTSDTYTSGGNEIPNSELDYLAVTGRYLHYSDIGGVPVAVQAILPVIDFFDPKIGGARLPTDDGLGDLVLGASVWPLAPNPSDPFGTTLGGSLFLTLPTGSYDFGSVSSGSGTTTVTPQIALQQGIGGGFFLDAYYDAAFALDFYDKGRKITTDPKHQAQAYLRYQPSAAWSAFVGYSGVWGGRQKLDNFTFAEDVEKNTIRFGATAMLTDTVQLGGRVDFDVDVDNGFKNEPLVELRLLTVF